MLRKLRIAFSVVCGIVCLLLIGLWARSYQSVDMVFGCVFETRPFKITSEPGRVHLLVSHVSIGRGGDWGMFSYVIGKPIMGTPPKIGVVIAPSNISLALPYWFVVLLSGAISILLLRPARPRFSLRTLLIATTRVAVVLGLAVAFG